MEREGTRPFDHHFDFKGDSIPHTTLIPKNIYREYLKEGIINCVDVILFDPTPQLGAPQGRYFTVVRKDKPAQNCRWMIGGRQLKEESFFDCARRKCKEEAGLAITPLAILGTYSTIFPDSSWTSAEDSNEVLPVHSVNTVVLAVVQEGTAPQLNNDHQDEQWIPLERDFLDRETFGTAPYMAYPQAAFPNALLIIDAFREDILRIYHDPKISFTISLEEAIRRSERARIRERIRQEADDLPWNEEEQSEPSGNNTTNTNIVQILLQAPRNNLDLQDCS